MTIIEINQLTHPGVEHFCRLTEAQLRNRLDSDNGIVIRVALDAGYEPVSLLCERRHIDGDARDIIERCPDIPVYTGSRDVLSQLTGYTLTRGVLCAMHRKSMPSLDSVCENASRVVVND